MILRCRRLFTHLVNEGLLCLLLLPNLAQPSWFDNLVNTNAFPKPNKDTSGQTNPLQNPPRTEFTQRFSTFFKNPTTVGYSPSVEEVTLPPLRHSWRTGRKIPDLVGKFLSQLFFEL